MSCRGRGAQPRARVRWITLFLKGARWRAHDMSRALRSAAERSAARAERSGPEDQGVAGVQMSLGRDGGRLSLACIRGKA